MIDTYLNLNAQEEAVFQEQLATIEPRQQEEVMEIVTSWMRQGIPQGRQQGAVTLVLRQLNRRLGAVSPQLQEHIQTLSTTELEDLGEALLFPSHGECLIISASIPRQLNLGTNYSCRLLEDL